MEVQYVILQSKIEFKHNSIVVHESNANLSRIGLVLLPRIGLVYILSIHAFLNSLDCESDECLCTRIKRRPRVLKHLAKGRTTYLTTTHGIGWSVTMEFYLLMNIVAG